MNPDYGRQRWQRRYDAARLRDADFSTLSGLDVDPVYGPPDGAVVPGFERIGWPGEFPFTRGLYPAGYRGRTWTIRQFSGFGNATATNERYKMLLRGGGGTSGRRARSGTAAWPSTRPLTWTSCSTGSRSPIPPRR